MSRNRHKPEQIIAKLREVEVDLARGTPVAAAVKKIAVTEQTYYRWRKEYGGLKVDQAKRSKTQEQEQEKEGEIGLLDVASAVLHYKTPSACTTILTTAAKGARTLNLVLGKHLLCQLSYRRVRHEPIGITIPGVAFSAKQGDSQDWSCDGREATKRRVPKLCHTKLRGIGYYVGFRDAETGMPRKVRFGNIGLGEAQQKYHAWLGDFLRTDQAVPSITKGRAEQTSLPTAAPNAKVVPGSLLHVTSSFIRYEEARTRGKGEPDPPGAITWHTRDLRKKHAIDFMTFLNSAYGKGVFTAATA